MALDITIIVPSHNSGPIIGHVLTSIDQGLQAYYPNASSRILVFDSSGAKNQLSVDAAARSLKTTTQVKRGRHTLTKGAKVLAGLAAAASYHSDATLMIDSDLNSIEPSWIKWLVDAVIQCQLDFVGPNYTRDKYDSLITNHIAYPMLAAITGCKLRQPIGGEFAFSAAAVKLYLRQPIASAEVQAFGIDIWVSTLAITHGLAIGQVGLGVKDHNKTIKDPQRPERSLGLMFVDVVKTLFDSLGTREPTSTAPQIEVTTLPGDNMTAVPLPVAADATQLWRTFRRLYPSCRASYARYLDPATLAVCDDLTTRDTPDSRFTSRLWATILVRCYHHYATLHTQPQKRALIEGLLALYFGRIGSFVGATQSSSPAQVEQLVQQHVRAFTTACGELTRDAQ